MEASDGEATIRTRALNFVVKANSAPQMQSLSPSMNQRFNKGDRIQFTATFTDQDNDALAYCWSERGKVLSTSVSFVKSDLPEGKHVIMLTVSDGMTVTATNLTLEDFFQPDVLFALKHDGKPLTAEHD